MPVDSSRHLWIEFVGIRCAACQQLLSASVDNSNAMSPRHDWHHVLEEVHTTKVGEGQKNGCPEKEHNLEMKVVVVRSQCHGEHRNKKKDGVVDVKVDIAEEVLSQWALQKWRSRCGEHRNEKCDTIDKKSMLFSRHHKRETIEMVKPMNSQRPM
ncbi:hypothetical protein Pyn_34015 [Prunus yedoensis var. nudiflora]|uniref:Uncharacterized protein n=1 Tax=Prunus yedoensis var. nudiflora TaxID=2094558 RepID=A0A314UF51_PRUYE|nr:hypothetical protein Pyn_34015 [Prunus yedoensis var. nudiflora]